MGILIKKYIWIAHLFLIALTAFFAAKILNTYLGDRLIVDRKFAFSNVNAPTIAQRILPGFETYQSILDRNIFDSRDVASAPTTLPTEDVLPPQEVDLNGPATRTSLSIKLLSTFSVGAGEDKRSTATVQSGSNTDVYTVEDEKQFAPGVKIKKILSDRIEFVNNNRLEYVELENVTNKPGMGFTSPNAPTPNPNAPKAPGAQTGNRFVIDQAEVDNALANLDKLFTEMRVVPNMVAGRTQGMKVISIAPNSLFGKLGLQRGDTIERINGLEMDIQKGMQIFNQLKGEKRITIDITRSNQKQTLDYEIR